MFSPITFQYGQKVFGMNLTTIDESSQIQNSSVNVSMSRFNETDSSLVPNGSFINQSSAILDESGECISTIAPTPNTAAGGVMPFLDENISVCPSVAPPRVQQEPMIARGKSADFGDEDCIEAVEEYSDVGHRMRSYEDNGDNDDEEFVLNGNLAQERKILYVNKRFSVF